MIYSSATQPLYQASKNFIPAEILAARKIETAEPSEINEAYLRFELTPSSTSNVEQMRAAVSTPGTVSDQTKGFARPKGPPRRH